MQEDNHVFQGLRRDNHQIRQDDKFLWDAHNIRLTNREDNTLLSITNEKGTSDSLVEFQGYYVGHCVLGKYLVVFTANDDGYDNYIYRVEKDSTIDSGYKTIILFHEENVWEGSWYPNHPIEAIGVYETEFVQKIYWVDGINQPRVINIAKPELKLPEYIDIGDNKKQKLLINGVNLSGPIYSTDPNIDQYLSYEYPNGFYKKESFNFVRDLQLREEVEIYRGEGNGVFSPGTIQYAFSYYNKYEQESNIFYTTPINYISPVGRGGSPEERVANFFTIEVYNCDINFEYVRVYSIHRTSIDAVPTVKIVSDIPINRLDHITFVDDGTKGTTIDPTQLLYVGGRSLIANCITSKDNTLFLGNIELSSKEEDLRNIITEDWEPDDWELPAISNTNSTGSTYYDYISPLSQGYLAGFKSGETYRCGVQFQTSDGVWSNPVFLADMELTTRFISSGPRESKAFTFLNTESLAKAGIKRMRACIVFPRAYERDVICQGVLCPTVYSVSGRRTNSPYAMSSWFFRPTTDTAQINNSSDAYHGSSIQFQHNKPLFTGSDRGAEIQNMIADTSITNVGSITTDNYDKFKSYFFVDENIVTFHSPDLEFDSQLQTMDWSGTRLRIIGMAQLDAISGDIDIQTETPVAYVNGSSAGFTHTQVGYQTRNLKFINGGLVSGLFYESGRLDEDYNIDSGRFFMVYPWHRSGSLNNDNNRPDDKGTRSSVLSKKIISNLKFFSKNVPLDDDILRYDISTPVLFNSNEISIVKIAPSYLDKDIPYMGNVDSMLTNSGKYPFYIGTSFHDPNVTTISGNSSKDKPLIESGSEPVRIKYKSSPHLVFSLSGDNASQIKLLPRHSIMGGTQNGNFTFPDWQDIGSSDGSNNNKGTYSGDFIYIDSGVFSGYDLTQYIVGKYAYDKPYGAEDGKYSVGLGKVNPNGKLVWDYTNHDGKIIRVVKNSTISSRKHGNIVPGITSSDWGGEYGNSYIGNTKYYKVISDGESSTGIPYYKLEEVSESSITSESASRTSGSTFTLEQKTFGNMNDRVPPYLLLAEIIRYVPVDIKFGGNTDEARRQNLWLPAGRPVKVEGSSPITVPFEYGDTWFSRYDCLKTYPFTQEDENQVVEIGSFMCETRVNIDGRYDRNRGQLSNLNVTPQNFNLLNEVYSQKDNFFNYRILDDDYYKQHTFANQITWSKEKHAGEEIDTWTNITLANTLDMDGNKGKVTALRAWNEHLLCFQEKALSQILFNSRVQIPTTDGVPIEISNGYKVDGSRLLSSNIGCSNKWATAATTTGVYFLDSNTDSIYIFNGQLVNLSENKGMDWWVRQNHTDKTWMPIWYNRNVLNGIRAFYDRKYGDIYFTPGPVLGMDQPDALCYSEQLGQFTSIMSYGGVQAMFNFSDGFYSLKETDGNIKLYQNNVGNYNDFYGTPKGWSFSFISNRNPTFTKIFDTIDLRTDHYWTNGIEQLLNSCPMNYIEVDNEYQHSGTVLLDSKNMRKKFRVWRGLLPRNKDTRQRIRNTWSMITLGWSPLSTTQPGDNTKKAIVHDVSVRYTV